MSKSKKSKAKMSRKRKRVLVVKAQAKHSSQSDLSHSISRRLRDLLTGSKTVEIKTNDLAHLDPPFTHQHQHQHQHVVAVEEAHSSIEAHRSATGRIHFDEKTQRPVVVHDMLKTSKILDLNAIYHQIPRVHCKGLCHEACGPIHVSDLELARMEQQHGEPQPPRELHPYQAPHTRMLTADDDDPMNPNGSCPYLDNTTKRCTVYDSRPLICRAYGAAEGLMCGHGCEVDARPITKLKVFQLIKEIEVLHGK